MTSIESMYASYVSQHGPLLKVPMCIFYVIGEQGLYFHSSTATLYVRQRKTIYGYEPAVFPRNSTGSTNKVRRVYLRYFPASLLIYAGNCDFSAMCENFSRSLLYCVADAHLCKRRKKININMTTAERRVAQKWSLISLHESGSCFKISVEFSSIYLTFQGYYQ